MVIYYIFFSILIVSLLSLIGVATFFFPRNKLENILIFLVSFSAGTLLGDCFIHILPKITSNTHFEISTALTILTGIIVFFILEKFIYWRHCHVPTSEHHPHPIVFMNLIGDGLHNFIDGMAIAGSYIISVPLGITTTIAVIFHEIPQEIGDFGVLIYGGYSKKKALLYNFFSSISAFFGAILIFIIKDSFKNLTVTILAFTAGSFIYIAGVDLLPELKKETEAYKNVLQLIGFVLGIAIMVLLLYIE